MLHKHGSILIYNISVFFIVVLTLYYLSMKVILSVKQKCLNPAWYFLVFLLVCAVIGQQLLSIMLWLNLIGPLQSSRMSKRRSSSERGGGETSSRAGKLLCSGIAGGNAKKAGPFVLGKNSPIKKAFL